MELPEVGVHCGIKSCNQLDFLPINCKLCGLTFCSEHGKADKHNCSKRDKVVDRKVPECPICGQPVPLRPNDSADDAVNRHVDAGCTTAHTGKKPFTKPRCAYNGCNDKSMVRTTCKFCSRPYCLRHRFEGDHDCPRRNSSAPPSLNIGTKAIDAINGVFSRSKSEQRQNPKPSNGNGSAARNGRNNVPPARNSSSTSNKSKDSGCVIS